MPKEPKSNDSLELMDDDQLNELLGKGFEAIDQNIDEEAPSQQWFEQFVLEKQQENRERFKRDLFIFIGVACIILTLLAITMIQVPTIFLVIQAVVFIVAILLGGVKYLKQVNNV